MLDPPWHISFGGVHSYPGSFVIDDASGKHVVRARTNFLGAFRRKFELFGFRHSYHLSASDSDDELYLVVGQASPDPGQRATAIREWMARNPCVLKIGIDDVGFAFYQSPAAAPGINRIHSAFLG